MSETGKQKLKGWRESAQKFLTHTLNTNMTPKERKQTWESLTEPKPSWETFKVMLGSNADPNAVLKKWRAWKARKDK